MEQSVLDMLLIRSWGLMYIWALATQDMDELQESISELQALGVDPRDMSVESFHSMYINPPQVLQ